MKPVNFDQANDLLLAAPGTEDLVSDLPVCRFVYGWNPEDGGQHATASCWELSFWERIKVALTGRVYCIVLARTHPPISLVPEIPKDIPKRSGPLPENKRRK